MAINVYLALEPTFLPFQAHRNHTDCLDTIPLVKRGDLLSSNWNSQFLKLNICGTLGRRVDDWVRGFPQMEGVWGIFLAQNAVSINACFDRKVSKHTVYSSYTVGGRVTTYQ